MNFLKKIFDLSKSMEGSTDFVNFVELQDDYDEDKLRVVKIIKYSQLLELLEKNKVNSEILAIIFACVATSFGILRVFNPTNGIVYNGQLLYSLLANLAIMQRTRSNDKIECMEERKEIEYNKLKKGR